MHGTLTKTGPALSRKRSTFVQYSTQNPPEIVPARKARYPGRQPRSVGAGRPAGHGRARAFPGGAWPSGERGAVRCAACPGALWLRLPWSTPACSTRTDAPDRVAAAAARAPRPKIQTRTTCCINCSKHGEVFAVHSAWSGRLSCDSDALNCAASTY